MECDADQVWNEIEQSLESKFKQMEANNRKQEKWTRRVRVLRALWVR